VTGIDISQGLLDIAQRIAPQGTYRLLPMEDMDRLEETFDAVFSQASLLHISKAEAAAVVQKMVDRLQPGGFLYIAVKEVKLGKPDEEVRTEEDYGYTYERFFSYYTKDEIEQLMHTAGLAIVSSTANAFGKTVWVQVIGQKPV
jgi:SAM-dependent methyltransferase